MCLKQKFNVTKYFGSYSSKIISPALKDSTSCASKVVSHSFSHNKDAKNPDLQNR